MLRDNGKEASFITSEAASALFLHLNHWYPFPAKLREKPSFQITLESFLVHRIRWHLIQRANNFAFCVQFVNKVVNNLSVYSTPLKHQLSWAQSEGQLPQPGNGHYDHCHHLRS